MEGGAENHVRNEIGERHCAGAGLALPMSTSRGEGKGSVVGDRWGERRYRKLRAGVSEMTAAVFAASVWFGGEGRGGASADQVMGVAPSPCWPTEWLDTPLSDNH